MSGVITIGQFLPGRSFFHRLDARTKILMALTHGVLTVLVTGAPGFALVGGATIVAAVLTGVPLVIFWRQLRPIVFFSVFTLVLSAFATPGEEAFRLGILSVSHEGIRIGLVAAGRFLLLMVGTTVVTATTSPIAMTDGLERLLRPFSVIGLPSYEIALMMTIALRFVPTLLEEAQRITRAQESRGGGLSGGSLMQRMQAAVPVLVPLFISTFRRADDLAVAMEARGFRGGKGRTRMTELRLTWRDGVAWAVLGSLATAYGWLRWLGQG